MPGIKRGVLISFEGVEGSGKTTQARALVDYLENKGAPFLFVRDPGSTEIGESIRQVLLNPEYKIMNPRCELFLFLAARAQLVYEKILPALNDKKIVVADRFSDSTLAYQVYGHNLPKRLISIFNRFASAGLKPDLTFLVDIDVLKGRSRGKINDRIEGLNRIYHEKVRRAYLRLAHRARGRIKVLNGERSVEELKTEVIGYVNEFLCKKGYKL